MPRVLVTPPMLHHGDWPYQQVLQSADLEYVFPIAEVDLNQPQILIQQLENIDAVMASIEPFNAGVLAVSKLKVVARVGVGYDTVDVPSATEHNVAVTITPGTNEHSVAEQAISMIVAISRGYPWRDQQVRRGIWDRSYYPRLSGQTLGLIGLGRIGKAVVSRAQGLGMKVIAFDPFPDQEFADKHDVPILTLDEVLASADYVSLHLPATGETHHLMNAETIGKMKSGSVLINTSRGALVDENAVAEAIESKHLMAAGLDVFNVEPLRTDSPLMKLERVLLSPHTGGLDNESIRDMSTLAAQCIVDLFQGKWPTGCVVNNELEHKWKW